MNLLITIIIPAYCHPNILSRCLAAIGQQTYKHDCIEIIVIDDYAPLILEKIVDQFNIRHPDFHRVFYYRNPKNSGRAKTRNVGLKSATGHVILFLDVDNVLEIDCCEKLANFFAESAGMVAVRCNVRLSDDSKKSSVYANFFNSRYLGQRSSQELSKIDFYNLPSKFFATDAVAVSKEAVDLLLGFDESFSDYGCEDEDMGIRLAKNNVGFHLGIDCHVIDADTPTIRRACERMTVYAQKSIPKLLAKHPEYSSSTLFAILEKPVSQLSFFDRFRRIILLNAAPNFLASFILKVLEKYDHIEFPMTRILYKYVLTSFYIKGIRQRDSLG